MREVFWSTGNYPTQLAWSLSYGEVLIHFKVLYLLCDKIIGSASFYYESPITRDITENLRALFEKKEIVYSVGDSVSSLLEHGLQKIPKSPSNFSAYRDERIIRVYGNNLDSIGNIIKRGDYSISDKIVNIWITELISDSMESIGGKLSTIISDKNELSKIKSKLTEIALNRDKDFVWEYIKPYLDNLALPKTIQSFIRRRLAQIYANVTAHLLGVEIDKPEYGLITNASKYDSALFLKCMDVLKISRQIINLNSDDLIRLKYSLEFIKFKEFYFSLIESMAFNQDYVSILFPVYIETEIAIPNIIRKNTEKEFIDQFKKYVKNLIGNYKKNYRKPLDFLLQAYSLFQKKPIDDLICILNRINNNKITGLPINSIENLGAMETMKQKKIFVAYGRHEVARKALFDLLRAGGLQPYEWEQMVSLTGETSPYIGDILRTGFENAQAAIIFFTGDDLAALRDDLVDPGESPGDYQPQPRPNVILEAGMALGLYPERTLIVQLGKINIREISDLIGRHIIKIDNNVDKRKTLLQRLKNVGCDVDMSGNDWINAGNFPDF